MMDPQKFSSMELSAIAEVLNISLGSSATAVSNMLNRRVDITTPSVHVLPSSEFELGSIDPAVGVEITYVSGLSGKNVMLLRRTDVHAIVDILMGQETSEEDFQLDELSMSAICEVMNQMMGASATALSEFLGRMVNISTPSAFEVHNVNDFREEYFETGEKKVIVGFRLSIEGAMESEFMNVMSCKLAKELVAALGLPQEDDSESELSDTAPSEASAASDGVSSQGKTESTMETVASPNAPQPDIEAHSQEKALEIQTGDTASMSDSSGGVLSQAEIEKLIAGAAPASQTPPVQSAAQTTAPPAVQTAPAGQMDAALLSQLTNLIAMQQQQMQQFQQTQVQSKVVHATTPTMPRFSSGEPIGAEQAQNLDLIMSVPLDVSVEIGRTKRVVRDILGFTKGSLIVLDTLAGDQVNLFVNGQCIARGDVVVVEDNFGIRITEVLEKPDLHALTK